MLINTHNPQLDNQYDQNSPNLDADSKTVYQCESVFPFALFPDIIRVDQNKVDIIYNIFFFSQSRFTILLEDIRTVSIDADLFFATLEVEIMGYEQNPTPIRLLPKTAAFEIRDIILKQVARKREKVHVESNANNTSKQVNPTFGSPLPNVTK
jgi:hypothetical protein